MLYVKIFVVAVDHFDRLNSLYQEVKTPCLNALEQNQLKRLLQARDDAGRTLLLWAVQKGSSETVQALLDTISASKLQKKLLFMTDDAGQTVLHCAASCILLFCLLQVNSSQNFTAQMSA